MINSALAYVAAALTAVVLFVAGAALASDSDNGASLLSESASTIVRPATTIPDTTQPPTPVVVPALGGMTPTDARALLRDAGLQVTTSEVGAVVAYAIDVVVASEPAEGATLFPGDTIDIVVGRRPSATVADRPTDLPWSEVDWVDAVDRTVGRCSIGRQDGVGLMLDAADCAGPHDFQYVGEVPLDTAPQDDQALADEVFERCLLLFEMFVGADYDGSSLWIATLTPSAAGWNEGNRTGDCLIRPPTWSQQIVGDAAGSLW